jgi:hypothetical protein
MGRACSTHWRGVHTEFQHENLKERDNWEDLDVLGSIILKLIPYK